MLSQNSRYHLKQFKAQAYFSGVKVIPEMETLGSIIRRRMKELKIESASELGRQIGVSSAYASDLVNDAGKTRSGTYTPSFDVIRKLADVLQISPFELLEPFGLEVGTDIAIANDVRLRLLKDYSPEDQEEFARAFDDAYFIALRRIGEKKKHK